MNHAPGTSVGPALLIALLAHFALPSAIAWAQEVQASVLIETAGQTPVSMDYWATERGVRIDIAQPQQMSIVWISGPPPKMLVVQHANRRYIEINEQMFQMMQQMMQSVSGGDGSTGGSGITLESLGFEPTGQTQTIGPWSAAEVRITGVEAGQDGILWITSDVETGLFDLLTRMAEPLDAMQLPMLGGGNTGPQRLMQFRQMGTAAGLPEGAVVRLTAIDQTGTTEITLQSLNRGPFPEDPLAPPPGYEPTQMPGVAFPE